MFLPQGKYCSRVWTWRQCWPRSCPFLWSKGQDHKWWSSTVRSRSYSPKTRQTGHLYMRRNLYRVTRSTGCCLKNHGTQGKSIYSTYYRPNSLITRQTRHLYMRGNLYTVTCSTKCCVKNHCTECTDRIWESRILYKESSFEVSLQLTHKTRLQA